MKKRTSIKRLVALMCGVGSGLCATHGLAQTTREGDAPAPTSWSEAVARATEGGGYLPLSLTPRVEAGRALGAGLGGYDSAKQGAVMRAFAEARVYRSLALRVGTRLGEGSQRFRPSVGARAQLLSQQEYGVDFAVALFYQAEGFTEPEGEIEGTVSVGRRLGRLLLLANLTYGQDPEAFERDGEVSVAGLVRLASWAHLGLDARARFDLGSERAKLLANNEPTYDVDAGPVLQLALGPLALAAHVGASAVDHLDQRARVGVVALAGLGTAF
jgi:hypothetical protein